VPTKVLTEIAYLCPSFAKQLQSLSYLRILVDESHNCLKRFECGQDLFQHSLCMRDASWPAEDGFVIIKKEVTIGETPIN